MKISSTIEIFSHNKTATGKADALLSIQVQQYSFSAKPTNKIIIAT